MSPRHRSADPSTTAAAVTPSAADQVRCSPERAQRLNDYIQGILPPHLSTTVDVVVTPAIQTAAVLPATAEALLDADGTELSPEQARHLVEQIDGEYLVLVTAQPASTDRIPVNDQLTADRAHQFGLAFHELLHILKTAVSGVASLLQDEVDEEYHDLVHDLVNTIEDGAIESEAIEGDNFSDNAAVRLGITRRIHSPTPDEVDPADPQEATFWDAVTAALYEYAIYPTGVVDVLTDPDDSRLVFTSTADREAFDAVDAELERLAAEALQIRSSELEDTSHTHDKDASIKRAKRVLETWETVLKPVLDDEARDQQRQQPPPPSQPQPTPGDDGEELDEGKPNQPTQAGEHPPAQASDTEQAADANSNANACPECDTDFDSDHGLRTHYGKQHGDTEDLDAARGDQAAGSGETGAEPDGDHSSTDADGRDTDSATGDDTGEAPRAIVPAHNPENADGVVHPAALDVDPEDITTDRKATDDPFQNILDHPSVDEHSDPDPDDVGLDPADYRPDPDDGASSEAGEPDPHDASETAPSHGGASIVSKADDASSADAGDPQSTAPADPESTAADSEQAADSASSPTGDGDPAPDDGETPVQGRDADEGGSRADPPATGQADASDGDDNTGASSSAGEPERGGDAEEAPPASSDATTDATRETDEPTDPADGGGRDTTRSSDARDLATHTDSGDASDGDGQLSLGDFTADSTPGSDTAAPSDQAGSDPNGQDEPRDTAGSEDVPTGDAPDLTGDTSATADGPASSGAPSPASDDEATESGTGGGRTDGPISDGDKSPSPPAEAEATGDAVAEPDRPEAGDAPDAQGSAVSPETPPPSECEPAGSEGAPEDAAAGTGEATGEPADSPDDAGPDGPAASDEMTISAGSRESSGPAHGDGDRVPDLDLEALETDRKRARDTAARATIDDEALADELAALDQALDDEADEEAESASSPRGGQDPGGGAGPGSLDELSVLPQGDERVPANEWEQIATNADDVADTLAKELSLDWQSAVRRGRTSGTYDTKTGYRLAYGDPRAFSSDLPGDEKRYALVLILDRSGSMGNGDPPKIRAATTAVARFALAAEQLDIDVAVIDFYRNEARLVKPFSVAVEHAQGALLAQETGGGTPLSDALSLGRTLVESQPTEPLLVTITDDKPRSVDAVETEIRMTYAPVCSLTIATDCRRGDPPAKAQRLERVYDRTATVYDAAMLDDRLDQFASLLAGY